jgi:hypothetical protein
MGNRGTGDSSDTKRTTRKTFLKATGVGGAWLALVGLPGCELVGRTSSGGTRTAASPRVPNSALAFRSRPDLSPPGVGVDTPAHNTASGYVFIAPKTGPSYTGPVQNGPMIVDDSGEVTWFRPMQGDMRAMDFKVQRYRGEPVITYYQGVGTTYGRGEYVILDSSYREVRRVRAGNGYVGDHHEFLITPDDTALLTIYSPVSWDLSSIGGPENGAVLDGIAQEVDIATGEVLFEWHSLDHVGIEATYKELPENEQTPFDYFHINSIDVDLDDNLLVSSRTTFAVYKIDRNTGRVIWKLGGKESDFEMGDGTWMRYQHDARHHPDGTITVFDNGGVQKDEQSSGIVLKLDDEEMKVSLVRAYTHPGKILAAVMGNVQDLSNSNVFIGWGSEPYFSEFSREGELLFSASFPPKVNSYRALRSPWKGQPTEPPAVAVEPASGKGSSDQKITVYASWNGATKVASWRALAGPGPDQLSSLGPVALREGFETAITLLTDEPYVGVQARDGSGRVLGTSEAARTPR